MNMKQNNNQLRSMLDAAKSLLARININYNSEIGPLTTQLVNLSVQMASIVRVKHPEIADILELSANNIVNRQPMQMFTNGSMIVKDFINAYSFGDMRTAIKILDGLYQDTTCSTHKIFISHSSKDEIIVTDFCDRILQLGIGISADDIFCTSIEDMNIKNGDDIRNHIKDNILSADFSFLLISDNYKKSEICLNEMGAVWASDNNVRYYILPNTDFQEIGWLCDTKQAELLTNSTALDKLYGELTKHYHMEGRLETWSRQREAFVNNYSKASSATDKKATGASSKDEIDEEILEILKDKPNLSSRDLANSLGLTKMSINRHLVKLQNSNKVEAIKTSKYLRWRVSSE